MARLALLAFLAIPACGGAISKTREIAPGVHMPSINLGSCCGSDPSLGVPAWLHAGGVGIDTAFDYNDQPEIAKALSAAKPAVTRSDVFITTKVPAGVGLMSHGRTPVMDCSLDPNSSLSMVREDLKQLGVQYVDLVLLHGPCELQGKQAAVDPAEANAAQWRGLEMALELGLTRSIGVSNYNVSHLEALILHPGTRIKPAVNQCQMSVSGNPFCLPTGVCLHGPSHDDATLQYCLDNGITYEAYDTMTGCPWHDAKLNAMAAKHGITVAQVCLRWTLQRGAIVVAGTGHNVTKVPLNTQDNLGVLDLDLEFSSEEMDYINKIRPFPSAEEAIVV